MNLTNFRHDYPYEIRPLTLTEGGGWLIRFPDLPGCVADGITPEEAIQNGQDALQSWMLTAQEFGDPIPAPSAIPRFMIDLPLPTHLPGKLTGLAQREGMSLETLITALLVEGLEKRLSV
jgi:antitoxin HicB